ncbi:putative bifunctional diguanylate cyclase/phosphodiesterase [Sphingopyxis sp. MWB1]|uniref:putative bifunctional diguanylate cyclase/phosphodiesterase n=1 Tax=Sphingopyxis sp. MWB1 TaxID=1537715 RepID=UPI00068D6047|nr:bifunctional diguanylate cyclase/phosphodiesterase [Sphingopyxis sp. MWB1]
MINVALCIAVEHDPWLVLLAVLVCAFGAFAIVQMFERARQTSGAQRAGWTFLTAVAAGATIWCTHFVAMLAYEAQAPVTLDPVLTIASLLVAMAGTGLGFSVAAMRDHWGWRLGGGLIVGAAISAMHYTGMAAYRVDGIIEWRWGYVFASLICSAAFSGAALAALGAEGRIRHRRWIGAALLVIAIASLHFVAMTALRITPLALSEAPLGSAGFRALGLATGLVGLVVIAAGVSAALIDRQTRSDAMERLHYMAMNDALTGLPNRSSFQVELARRLRLAEAQDRKLAVVAIDLDRFKEINDIHGHKAGDEVLIALSRRMQHELGERVFVARLGGDEFVALIDWHDGAELRERIDKLDEVMKAPLRLGDFDAHLGASIGVACYPGDATTAEGLTNNADLAMYRAKNMRSLGPCFYDAVHDEAVRERRELANDLRRAIDNDELEVHYQVQASVTTGDVTGYEALLRWTHPERGPVPPESFIAIAEENGLILALGEWVLRRACADAASWSHDAKVAINVSPVQLAHAGLPQLFHQVMLDTGLPPRRLEIELTETAIMADRDRALHVLRQIKALGVGVALDDFGTGYSSLETLRAFPFDKIKIDRIFATELESSQEATAIVRAVLALGKSLSIPVLAEGIETDSQLEVLLREGCDEAQGYLLGYPALGPVSGESPLANRPRSSAAPPLAGDRKVA